MTTKIISKVLLLSFLTTLLCCKTTQKGISQDVFPCIYLPPFPEEKNYIFENWYKVDSSVCEDDNIYIICKSNRYLSRSGYFKNGKLDGKWTAETLFTPIHAGTDKTIRYILREEYFKNGLRDSIYKIYNKEGKVVYSTYFKNGNGIEKDFHNNGKLHYEIATKDGYFTDTLKLYNDEGKLKEKFLYKKDSLVYHEIFISDDNPEY
jgi:antitoxin component YwqK of YwqJK toxin-antitoxin module